MAQEIELKLCFTDPDPASLASRLAKIPVLARRKPNTQTLLNIYFDTPDLALHHKRVALRLRRIGDETNGLWLQTLKTSGSQDSALSRRGEWESPVPGQALMPKALEATPWPDIDPDGSLMAALSPCFMTVVQRTLWLVRSRDGTEVELALDLGDIEAKGQHMPICELELELKAGQTSKLFEIAQNVAKRLAVLPASLSKAQRGYLLAQGESDHLSHAQSPGPSPKEAMPVFIQKTLHGMFTQFTANLITLQTSDDPELVHQARIGWRRFRTGLWLFKKVLKKTPPPSRLALQPLLHGLSELRNLDVACTQTLPPLAAIYAMGSKGRAHSWQAMMRALTQAAATQRQTVRLALQEPAVGSCLLALSEWLEQLSSLEYAQFEPQGALQHWAKRRIKPLKKKLKLAQTKIRTPQDQHHVRILAKRLRYGTEALRYLLPPRLAKQCRQQAENLQSSIGANRDIWQTIALMTKLKPNHKIEVFLQGISRR
ncbi:MAG: hypothetical protein FD135_1438 [Comamonadaceae bacterium]|nr:MAG: hypothetical protein FD135_1438 [Comamonadaceae bacterium]